MDETELFEQILQRSVVTPTIANASAWWPIHCEATGAAGRSSVATAVLGGFAADRLGYAFASGYTAALSRLLALAAGAGRAAPPLRRRALCASEVGGAHPRAIACALDLDDDGDGGGRLVGEKSFVTLGSLAEELLIVARVGEDVSGRPQLRVAKIPSTRAGVSLEPAPATPFVPEIPHARVLLREVAVAPDELLPGDGYLDVLKPFRTIEDTHVFLGLLGWLVKLGRQSGWSDDAIERLLHSIAALATLARSPAPLSPALHRVLAGAIAAVEEHLFALERSPDWTKLDDATRQRWARDRPLLGIAGRVRGQRLAAARAR